MVKLFFSKINRTYLQTKLIKKARWSKEEIKGIEKYEFENERSHICYANFQYVVSYEFKIKNLKCHGKFILKILIKLVLFINIFCRLLL